MSEGDSVTRNGPVVTLAIFFCVVLIGCTAAWTVARPAVALIYGLLRSVELPFLNALLPHGTDFHLSTLRKGYVPEFWSIYKNSLIYGMFWFMMSFVVMFVAVSRLSANAISSHVNVPSKLGHSVKNVLERYATTQPHVRFFIDYDVVGLPTALGTARQAYTALDLLLYTNAIDSIALDPVGGDRPKLNLDRVKLEQWYRTRMGDLNPFVDTAIMPNPRLMDKDDIEKAVSRLNWASVLILAPAVKRIVSFYSEATVDGLKTRNDEVSDYINRTWREINSFKQQFGDGITLGYASEWDRAERVARFASGQAAKAKAKAKGKKKAEAAASGVTYMASVETDAKTALQRVFEAGFIARGETDTGVNIPPVSVGPQPDKIEAVTPPRLLFFSEVLAERGPSLKIVAEGREILKDYLTRHLGSQREWYPVGIEKRTEVMRFAKVISSGEEQAFNQKAQERLNTAMQAVEKCLFNHAYEFGAVGATLDKARESGIMPPSLFRYLRFCDETQSLWWFVHNLGMPSAVPENAGLFEHYQAERLSGVALLTPYIRSSIDGLKNEAEKYLTDETVHDLNRILGGNALERTTRARFTSIGDTLGKAVGGGSEMEAIWAAAGKLSEDMRSEAEKAKDRDTTIPQHNPAPQDQGDGKQIRTVQVSTHLPDLAAHVAGTRAPDPAEMARMVAAMTGNAVQIDAQRGRQMKAERDHARQEAGSQDDDSGSA